MVGADAALKLKQQYLGYNQKEIIATKQVTRLEKRAGQFRDIFFRLFTSAKIGLNISSAGPNVPRVGPGSL